MFQSLLLIATLDSASRKIIHLYTGLGVRKLLIYFLYIYNIILMNYKNYIYKKN